jgi:hypothetical protein
MKSHSRLKAEQIISRLNGLSVGPVGVAWKPRDAEIDIAQEVITFMEDRRVLFNDNELEVPRYCVESVLEIRRFLTEVLRRLKNETGLSQHLRAMRGACRRFLNKVQDGKRGIILTDGLQGGSATWTFFPALGELRAAFGLHLGIIAASCGLGMEGELASILPAPADDSDSEDEP